ncbi:MAG: glycosyltransferase family 4 protein [Candidatus Peribacteraceae bacterium]|nr:glycosyltransferase family 4 protein [Candidatus Peribacteraceae bacterium]
MKLLMISGDRSLAAGKKAAFWYTLELLRTHFERIDIITPQAADSEPPPPFDNVFLHPSPRGLLRQPGWIVRKGRELIARHGHGVMTVHEYPPFYNGIGALRLSRKTGVPAVLEIHHIVGKPIASSASELAGRVLSRLFLPPEARRFAAVRTVNQSVRATLMHWGVPGRNIAVVPSFYLNPDVLEPEWLAPKLYDFVFCGRLAPNKGLCQTLDALRRIPDATLLVIGDGPERAACERRARRWGIADRVTFAGWLPTQEDVVRHVRSARTFILQSRSEGGPRVALEAMACGLPVIATPVGIMPEVIRSGENGILVPFGTGPLLSAMKLLLSDTALRGRIGHAAVEIVARFERRKAIAAYAEFLTLVGHGA